MNHEIQSDHRNGTRFFDGLTSVRPLFGLLLCGLLAVASPVLADEEKTFTFDADELTVQNLIGEVRVEGHSGSQFEVLVSVRGDDATPGLIGFEAEDGRHSRLNIVFPKKDRFVYPHTRSRTTIRTSRKRGDGFLSGVLDGFFGDSVKISNSGDRHRGVG